MAEGSFDITFQGFVCQSVSFRNSHGLEPDASLVEIFVKDYQSFSLAEGKAPGRPRQIGDLSQPNAMYTEGDLDIRVTVDGATYQRRQASLYVDSVSKDNSIEPSGVISVSLLDVRHLFNRGYLSRWRFNTLPDEPPASLYEIVESIVGDLPGVVFNSAPQSWNSFNPPYEFDEMGRPREAMRQILNDYDAVFCLNEDNSVSIYLEGEESSGNIIPPESLIEHDGGRGHSVGSNVNYRPESVLVVGGDRIGTVRVGNWEPVLNIDGNYVPLVDGAILLSDRASLVGQANESVSGLRQEAIKALREGRAEEYDRLQAEIKRIVDSGETDVTDFQRDRLLQRIRRFLVMPDTWRNLNGFSQEGMEILKRDAYRLFRLPGADGVNRELLPLLKRAELDNAGRRLPVLVRRYGWERVNSSFLWFENEQTVQSNLISSALVTIRNILFGDISLKTSAGENDPIQIIPVDGGISVKTLDGQEFIVDVLDTGDNNELRIKDNLARNMVTFLNVGGIDGIFSGFQSGRVIAQANIIGETSLAEFYAKQVDEYHKLQLELNPAYTGDLEERLSRLIYEAAEIAYNELSYLQAAGEADFNLLTGSIEAQRDNLGRLLLGKRNEIDEIKRQIRERKRLASGGDDGERDLGKPKEVYYFVNWGDALVDNEAKVEDYEAGVIRTSQPAMQLLEDRIDAATLAGTGELAPGPGPGQSWPVSVEFGTRVVPAFRRNPVTGDSTLGPDDIVPPQMAVALNSGEPELGTFHAFFKIQPDGSVFQTTAGGVSADKTVSVSMPNLTELITLTDGSNESTLLKAARGAAQARLRIPTASSNSRIVYLHPHGTRCDGVVSAVAVRSRRGMLGVQTVVVKGRTESPFEYGNKTTTRRNKLDEMRGARPLPTGRNFVD